MELRENEEESCTIILLFLGKKITIRSDYKMNFKELLKDFLQLNSISEIDLDKFVLTINGKTCLLEETLESYRNDIISNHIFELSLKIQENKDDQLFLDNLLSEIEPYVEEDLPIEISRKNFLLLKKTERAFEDKYDLLLRPDNFNIITFNKKSNNFDLEINIKFIKTYKNIFNKRTDTHPNLPGLLKLCLLKEIACVYDLDKINTLPDNFANIMNILKRGNIEFNDVKEEIVKVLKRIKGGNIMSFSNYVDNLISQSDINKYLLSTLNIDDKKDIIYIRNCLEQYVEYIKLFEKEFERAKRNSIFEYSIISLTIMERDDINNFEKNRRKCKNRVDRVLFHGTSYDSISCILPDLFRKANLTQHGKGVYFTEDLDSCWIYGSQNKNKNINSNKRNLDIPKIGQKFTFIASSIYYDKNGFRRVYNNEYNPKRNEVNFAYAEMENLETVLDEVPDKTKFYSTEYVINSLDQICPFMSLKLKRDEYCVIWRDSNFSSQPVYGNKFDKIFKKFLKERMKYINQLANFNMYPCENSEEALELIRRKKYNKIILISNIGINLEGKEFITDARKIIGNDVIALFLAYNIDHLNWVKNFKNALFSNDPEFYQKYLDCFNHKNEKKVQNELIELKESMENHFGVKFNFDNNFLFYPHFNQKVKKLHELRF